MTFRPSAPHKRPRWLALLVVATTMLVLAAGFAFAHSGINAIPANYAGGTQVDVHGANDVPGQVDVTQMGRDTSQNPDVLIFWSWDSISAWTGKGQTGDACALFDNDSDGNINYVVCARVSNPNADPDLVEILPASTDHPVYLFDCTDKKNDRCTQPSPRDYTAGQVLAGPFGTISQTGAGNLITDTDPFPAGESNPHDTSIEVRVASILVPTGASLVNVCSYPSAGNGGNNNPFDCIVTPGVQFGTLRVTKTITNDNGGTKVFSDFSFTAGSGAATTGVIGATAFDADGIIDTQVPVGTYSVIEVGTPIAGYDTSYSNCTSVSVTAGNTTTCAITNNDQAPSLTLIKNVTNDNGGTAVASDWTLTATGYDSASPDAGTYPLSESGPGGYTLTSLTCDNSTGQVTSVTLGLGENVTCTFVNDDDIATPGIATVMKWTLNDRTVMTGWLTGGGASTVTFSLYKDSGTNVSCEPATLVTSFTEAVNDATGSAATTTGYTTEVAGTYHWIAAFNGNSFNGAISSNCADETTVLP